MSDFFKNNPIALRHCLLYKFFYGESVEEAFDKFFEIVGSDVIEKECVQYWFNQFEKGKFDDEEQPVINMKDILRNDKYALRTCILYESMDARRLQLEPDLIHRFALSMYELFCKVIEDDAMEYREYEFWFYRFANGEVDFNFERDKDKKLYELTDMPIDIMRNIVGCLTIVDRLSLERTSKSLRLFSKDQKVFHRNLTFEADWKSANISFGRGPCISYENQQNDCVVEFRNRKKVLHGVSCLKQAFQDFKNILANPNLYLNTLTIWSSCEESKSLGGCIEDAMKFTHLLRVEHIFLHAQSMKTLLNILPYLKPGHLTTITIDTDSDDAVIEKVVGMDQWKHAKYFHMRSNRFIGPLRHLYHFKEFDVRYNELSVEDVREMKEILLKSPEFEECTLYLRGSVDRIVIMQVFGGPINGSSKICHYPIPNSTDYFEIFVGDILIKILRKKK